MYVVYWRDYFVPTSHSRSTPIVLASYLKETFPEIAKASSVTPASFTGRGGSTSRSAKIRVDDVEYPALMIRCDTSFLQMFDVKILEGSAEFLIPGSKKLAITQEKALELFGNEHPIGKKIDFSEEICAIVSGMSKQSIYAFDLIGAFFPLSLMIGAPDPDPWSYLNVNTFIELLPGTNINDFSDKLYEHVIDKGRRGSIDHLKIKPITKIRTTDSKIETNREVKFQHIFIFAISGLLVVICSLFNYLTLFVSRFRIRQRELALRMVCGASGGSLLVMLSVEFMLTLLFAVLLGGELAHLFHEPFLRLSEIQMSLSDIYLESFLYICGVIMVSLLLFWLILTIFQKRSLDLSIRRSNKKLFRKASVIVQLVISIGFSFSTVVILKQIYYLHHSGELGFSFNNRGCIVIQEEFSEVLENQLKQIPEITEMYNAGRMINLLPEGPRSVGYAESWDSKPDNADRILIESINVTQGYCDFFDFKLLAGEMLTENDPATTVLVNESAVKAFGWDNPVGKHFDRYLVKGVIKNIYNLQPTVADKPIYYANFKPRPPEATESNMRFFYNAHILFKYSEGTWKTCSEKIDKLLKDDFPYSGANLYNMEEEYDKFLVSERALIKLLSLVAAICVLISVFGFVSLVSLTCEERRKDIAIRKINGATVGDILSIFAKEYATLLIIGAVIAFSSCYFIMQRWLEQYVKKTDIPAWIYLSLLFVMALVIVLCVGWQVYKTSKENPAEVISK